MNSKEDTYKTIRKLSKGIFKDRGSKFLSFAYPVSSEKEAHEIIDDLKKQHHSARHHCFAYRIGADKSIVRSSDAGEPSNSAGKPILNQIISHDLTNIVIIVVRYFGGTLLGIGGLIKAYKNAAADAIKNADVLEKIVSNLYKITYQYAATNEVMKILKEKKLRQLQPSYEQECSFTLCIGNKNSDHILQQFRQIESVSIEYLNTQ